MNKVVLMGRLTRDPEVRYVQGVDITAIANFSLAVDRRGIKTEGQQQADFIRITAFGKLGEFCEKYLHKGTKITLSGRIQTGSYTNKDGVKVYTTAVVADEIEFAESKGNAESKGKSNEEPPVADSGDGFMNIPDGLDEELPFN